jgi:hypothetical protein
MMVAFTLLPRRRFPCQRLFDGRRSSADEPISVVLRPVTRTSHASRPHEDHTSAARLTPPLHHDKRRSPSSFPVLLLADERAATTTATTRTSARYEDERSLYNDRRTNPHEELGTNQKESRYAKLQLVGVYQPRPLLLVTRARPSLGDSKDSDILEPSCRRTTNDGRKEDGSLRQEQWTETPEFPPREHAPHPRQGQEYARLSPPPLSAPTLDPPSQFVDVCALPGNSLACVPFPPSDGALGYGRPLWRRLAHGLVRRLSGPPLGV